MLVTVNHPLGSKEHSCRQRAGEDNILSRVQERERGRYLNRRFLVLSEVPIVLCDFVFLIIEMLLDLVSVQVP